MAAEEEERKRLEDELMAKNEGDVSEEEFVEELVEEV